jgi:hypothetical protein
MLNLDTSPGSRRRYEVGEELAAGIVSEPALPASSASLAAQQQPPLLLSIQPTCPSMGLPVSYDKGAHAAFMRWLYRELVRSRDALTSSLLVAKAHLEPSLQNARKVAAAAPPHAGCR